LTVYYVRKQGSDSNPGSIDRPLATVGAAAVLATHDDVIDVGAGLFIQPTMVTLGCTLRGQGWDKTIIQFTAIAAAGIQITDPTTPDIAIHHCHLKQLGPTDLIKTVNMADGARLSIVRCVLSASSGHAVRYTVGSANVYYVDVLNSVVRPFQKSANAMAFWAAMQDRINAFNNIFINLWFVVDDTGSGRRIATNYNLYYNNYRDLRAGDYGQQDIRDQDPQFQDFDSDDYRIGYSSPARDAGYDLTVGFGKPFHVPSSVANWGFVGTSPDIGVFEAFKQNASAVIRSADIHLLLKGFADEFDTLNDKHAYTKRGRSLDDADASQLQARWGDLLGVYRPYDSSLEDYRLLVRAMDQELTYRAPAAGAIDRAVELLYDTEPQRIDYNKSRRFPLSGKLKLRTKYGVPPQPFIGWTPVKNQFTGNGNSYYAVHGNSSSNVWAVGQNGQIIRWNGVSWLTVTSPQNVDWNTVIVLPSGKVVIAGMNQYCYYTTNNGTTWQSLPVISDGPINLLFPVSENEWLATVLFFGAARYLYRTTNAGATWTKIRDSDGTNMYDIWAFSSTQVYLAMDTKIVFYNGSVWSTLYNGSGLRSIWGTSPTDMWLTGISQLRYSSTNWASSVDARPVSGCDAFHVRGSSSTNVYIAGADGNNSYHFMLKRVAPGLADWDTYPPLGQLTQPTRLYVAPDGIAFAVGTKSGTNMSQVPVPTGGWGAASISPIPIAVTNFNDVLALSETEIYIAANGGYVFKFNGTTWTAILVAGSNLQKLWASASNDIWAVGGTVMYHSTDHGVTWQARTAPGTESARCIWGVSSSTFWVGTDTGHIYRTTDGGTSYTLQLTLTTGFRDLWGTGATNVWACGTNGVLAHYNGTTWTNQTLGPTNKDLLTVWGLSASDVYVGGNGLWHSTDNGVTWIPQTTPLVSTAGHINAVRALDADNYYAAVLNSDITPIVFQVLKKTGTNSWTYDTTLPPVATASLSQAIGIVKSTGLMVVAGAPYHAWFYRFSSGIGATASLFVQLTAGDFQLNRRWYRAKDSVLKLDPNSTSVIYADGSVVNDESVVAVKASADQTLLRNFRLDVLTGTLVFKDGSDEVTGAGTAFRTELSRHDKIRLTGTSTFYVIDSIEDNTHLTLRKVYQGFGDDGEGTAEKATKIAVFGTVNTNSDGVIAIHSQGRLGDSALLNDRATKGHGFHLVVDTETPTDSIFDDTDRSILLEKLLCKAKPVYKLGYLSFRTDYPAGKLICFSVDRNAAMFVDMKGGASMTLQVSGLVKNLSAILVAGATETGSALLTAFGDAPMSGGADLVLQDAVVEVRVSSNNVTSATISALLSGGTIPAEAVLVGGADIVADTSDPSSGAPLLHMGLRI
jgi:hypothetical protein